MLNCPYSDGQFSYSDGTGQDGTGRDGTGWDGTGRDRTGRDGIQNSTLCCLRFPVSAQLFDALLCVAQHRMGIATVTAAFGRHDRSNDRPIGSIDSIDLIFEIFLKIRV